MEIVHLYISPGHNYFGHHGRQPDDHPAIEVDEIECIAGSGIRGDRFFDYKDNYKGQITFFAEEVFAELCAEFGIHDKRPSVLRRNVITRGQDLRKLIGRKFELQSVRLRGTQECRPCYWMDEAFAPGAERFLRGRGGLRARILSDGVIRARQAVPV
ncbi:MAG: molybdenum cofactor biosysynthesis protein [Chthoniobacterales bacterium]|nr:MAG: molybdenum cofactor biosysynthesis protein [Chthoniobacterales bacterium]